MLIYETVYIVTNTIYIFTISKLFQIFFDEENCNNKLKSVILIFYFFLLSSIIFITRIPIIILTVNLFFLSLLSLSYTSSFQKKIISISFIYAIGIVIELLSSTAFGFFELSGIKNSTFNSISVLIFIRMITLIIVYVLSRYKSSLKKEYNIPKIYYLAFFVVLFGTLYLFISRFTTESITVSHILVSGIILITVNATIIVIDEKIYESIVLENEKKILRKNNEALQNQMEIINQSTEAIKLLKHDFKNHLIMLSTLYKNGETHEIQTYIDTILGNIESEAYANSNNFMIDSIINFKLRSVKSKKINCSVNINVPITLNILAHDLTVVLSNLLDNAITACEKSKQKILDIKITANMGNLIILIDNSYGGKIIDEKGNLKTTKLYKIEHGLGLTSVKKTLEKCDGEIKINYTNDMFSVSVVIPY